MSCRVLRGAWSLLEGVEQRILLWLSALALLAAALLGAQAVLPLWVESASGEWSLAGGSAPRPLSDRAVCDMFQSDSRGIIWIESVWHQSNYYPNLFQTSDGNTGVRFEMAPSGDVAGLIVSSAEPQGFSVFPAQRGETEALVVVYIVEATSVTVVQEGEVPLVSSRGKDVPSCSNLLLGTGFDGTRNWLPEATVSYKVERKSFRFLPDWIGNRKVASGLRIVAISGFWIVSFTLALSVIDLRSARRGQAVRSCKELKY